MTVFNDHVIGFIFVHFFGDFADLPFELVELVLPEVEHDFVISDLVDVHFLEHVDLGPGLEVRLPVQLVRFDVHDSVGVARISRVLRPYLLLRMITSAGTR